MRPTYLLSIAALLLVACSPPVKRATVLNTAHQYATLQWQPELRHILHGTDCNGIIVHTPDTHTDWHDASRGSWKPNTTAIGMPYQWGGFDTPSSFHKKIAAGFKAGDIASSLKRKLGDDGTSKEACGIDCSGFVSRCWNLRKPYSTKELPQICTKLNHWSDLKTGDIVLNSRHVILFKEWSSTEPNLMLGYDAGPTPTWQVHSCGIPMEVLINDGYAPWRYHRIVD